MTASPASSAGTQSPVSVTAEAAPDVRQPAHVIASMLGVAAALAGLANVFRFDTLDKIPPGDFNLLGLAVAGVAVAWSVVWLRPQARTASLMTALYVVVVAVSWLHPGTTEFASTKRFLFIVAVPILYLVGSRCLSWSLSRKSFLTALTTMAVITTVGLLGWGTQTADRTAFDGGDPISQARVAAMGSLVGIVLFLRGTRAHRLVGAVVAMMCGAGAAITGSRGPFIVLGIAVIVILVIGGGRHRFLRGLVTLGIITVGLYVLFSESGSMTRVLGANTDQSNDERSTIVQGTLEVVQQHPLGIGLGNLWWNLPPGALVPGAGESQYPHNVIVEAAAEGGLLAGVLLAILCVISGVRILRQRSSMVGQMLIGTWIIGVGSAMTSSDLTGNRMMWVMLGVGMASAVWNTRSQRDADLSPSRDEPHPTPERQFGHP